MKQRSVMAASVLLLFLVSYRLIAQEVKALSSKPVIDTSVFRNEQWPNVSPIALSPFGRYLSYMQDRILVIKDTSGSWTKEIENANFLSFSADEKKAFVLKGDSLFFVRLGKDEYEKVLPAESVSYPLLISFEEKGGKEEWVLINLASGKEEWLGKADKVRLGNHGVTVWVFSKSSSDSSLPSLNWVDISSGTTKEIWTGKPDEEINSNISMNQSEERIAFLVQNKNDKRKSLYYYQIGSEKAALKLAEGDQRLPENVVISDNGFVPVRFSANGKWIFCTLRIQRTSSPIPKPGSSAVMVDIWGYKDPTIKPFQPTGNQNETETELVAISTEDNHLQVLTSNGAMLNTKADLIQNNEVVISRVDSSKYLPLLGGYGGTHLISYFILSLRDGSEKPLKLNCHTIAFFSFSPDGRWLVYWDTEKGQWYSYELSTGTIRNLTGKINARFKNGLTDDRVYMLPEDVIGGWIKDADRVLLYDTYDVWSIDPSLQTAAINETKGYGRIHHIKLRFIDKLSEWRYGDSFLLKAFNLANKYNGFFSLQLGNKTSLQLLTMGPYVYDKTNMGATGHGSSASADGVDPIKASKAGCWLVKRQSATEAPNLFITNDFNYYRQITNLQPQEKYRWLNSELVNYKQLDGEPGLGILYKPEGFNPKKKYPVIFSYYEQRVKEIYEFRYPELMDANIDVPWFVSRGYMVFIPDIYYSIAARTNKTAMESAFDAVEGAAKYLEKLPFVDNRHMALSGHSFGAAETIYIIAHSHSFAAGIEFSGLADQISSYLWLGLGLDGGPKSTLLWEGLNLGYYEDGQGRLGATLWQRPDLYIKASPILDANKITAPLLMIHDKDDVAVPFRRGVELYVALRRLQKPSWMLQYDGDGHSLSKYEDCMDFTIRLTEFFNHYLKGYPPPMWMTKGIPAKLKGIETGYDLDADGSCGPDCPVCKKKDYKEYYDLLKNHPEELKW